MPMFPPLSGQTRGAHKRASAFVIVLALALALSQTLSASLVQALTVDELSSGSVLGDTTYPSVRLTSSTNQSLTVMATPVSFASGQWTYKFDWTRVRNAQGSLYITLKSNKSTKLLSIDTAAKTGSETAQLDALTSYRFEFYSQTSGRGAVLLRKFFTTMGDPSGNATGDGNGGTSVIGSMSGSYNPNIDNASSNTFYVAPGVKTKNSSDPVYFVAKIGNAGGVNGFPSMVGEMTLTVKNLPAGMHVKFFKLLPTSRFGAVGQDLASLYTGDVPTSVIPTLDLVRFDWGKWNQLDPNPGATPEIYDSQLFDGYLVRPESEYSTTVVPGNVVIMQLDTNAAFTAGAGSYPLKAVLSYDIRNEHTQKEVSFGVVIPTNQLTSCLTALSDKTKYPAPFMRDVKPGSTFPNISNTDDLFKSFGNGTEVYYDNDYGVWRKMSTTITDPPKACDKLIAADVLSSSEIYKFKDGTVRDFHRQWIVEGETVDIQVVAPPSVKSATLYLMKETSGGGNATEANMGLMGLSSLSGGSKINPDDVKNDNPALFHKGTLAGRQWRSGEVDTSKIKLLPYIHPQVAITIGTVTLVNGKGSIKWTVPRMDPLVDSDLANNPFASRQQSIRVVADNGIWSDSPHFSVVTNNQSCGSSGLMGKCDRSKVTRVTGGLNNDTIIDHQTTSTYLARSFGQPNAPSILWAMPTSQGVDKNNDDFIKEDLNKSWVINPGGQVKLYAYQYNVGDIKEVDLDLIDFTSNCKYDYSTEAQDSSACEINFRTQTNDNQRKKWTIATGVKTGINRVIDPKTNFWKWTFEYTFTLPADVPPGRYIVRMVDPAYAYDYKGLARGSFVYPGYGAKYSNYVTIGNTSGNTSSKLYTTESSPNPTLVDGVSGVCQQTSLWWFRNSAPAFNVYRNTTNNSSSAQKIVSAKDYTDSTYGSYSDVNLPAGTYYYWVENVVGSTKVPAAKNATGGILVSVCK